MKTVMGDKVRGPTPQKPGRTQILRGPMSGHPQFKELACLRMGRKERVEN